MLRFYNRQNISRHYIISKWLKCFSLKIEISDEVKSSCNSFLQNQNINSTDIISLLSTLKEHRNQYSYSEDLINQSIQVASNYMKTLKNSDEIIKIAQLGKDINIKEMSFWCSIDTNIQQQLYNQPLDKSLEILYILAQCKNYSNIQVYFPQIQNPLTDAVCRVSEQIYTKPLIECLYIYMQLNNKLLQLNKRFHELVSRHQEDMLIDLPQTYWDKCAILSNNLLNQSNRGVSLFMSKLPSIYIEKVQPEIIEWISVQYLLSIYSTEEKHHEKLCTWLCEWIIKYSSTHWPDFNSSSSIIHSLTNNKIFSNIHAHAVQCILQANQIQFENDQKIQFNEFNGKNISLFIYSLVHIQTKIQSDLFLYFLEYFEWIINSNIIDHKISKDDYYIIKSAYVYSEKTYQPKNIHFIRDIDFNIKRNLLKNQTIFKEYPF